MTFEIDSSSLFIKKNSLTFCLFK